MKSILSFALLAVITGAAYAVPVEYTTNGHWYEVIIPESPINWNDAKVAAQAAGGYLATPTSAGENSFIFGIIPSGAWTNLLTMSVGPWIGGTQPVGSVETAGGWSWVTAEAWSYTNWAAGQPDDGNGGGENSLMYWNSAPSSPAATWNDVIDTFENAAYVIEWNTNPVPEPSSLMALAGVCGFLAMRRKAAH